MTGDKSAPRPLTPDELAWLLREGREFQAEYHEIRARVRPKEKPDTSGD